MTTFSLVNGILLAGFVARQLARIEGVSLINSTWHDWILMSGRTAVFLVLMMCQPSYLFAQTVPLAGQSLGRTPLPKPAADMTAGTWKYRVNVVQGDGAYTWTHSVAVKDDGSVWTVTYTQQVPEGTVTDVQVLEKGTLILRKETFKHFAKPRDSGPFTVTFDFTERRVTGTTNRGGQDKPLAIDLGGPLFPGQGGLPVTIGCLPLADGYSTTVPYFDVQRQTERLMQLTVAGTDRVSVPAGTFDSYRVELASADGGSPVKETLWIAIDSRTPVKVSASETVGSGTMVGTTVLIP